MAWRLLGAKPLSEPMLTWLTDAYMQHSREMSWYKDGFLLAYNRDSQSYNCLIFVMGFHIPGKNSLYIETAQWWSVLSLNEVITSKELWPQLLLCCVLVWICTGQCYSCQHKCSWFQLISDNSLAVATPVKYGCDIQQVTCILMSLLNEMRGQWVSCFYPLVPAGAL